MASKNLGMTHYIQEFNSLVFQIINSLIRSSAVNDNTLTIAKHRLQGLLNLNAELCIEKIGPLLHYYREDILLDSQVLLAKKNGTFDKMRSQLPDIYGVDRFLINTEQHELSAVGSKKENSKTNKFIWDLFIYIKPVYEKFTDLERDKYRILAVRLYRAYTWYDEAKNDNIV